MFETVILLVAFAVGLYMAWNIGANDVANAFGTSVGSGAITFRKAMVLAAIFEFSGAFFAGSYVSDTIRGNIVVPEFFTPDPGVFAIGMLSCLLAASLWLNLATYLGQPVSTTHAVIGAVVGFGLASFGPHCIQWHKLTGIAASWVISPVFGAILSFIVYYAIRRFVLRNERPVARARYAVPLGLAGVSSIMLYSILQGLYPRVFEMNKVETKWLAAFSALVVANVAGVLVWVFMRRRCRCDSSISEQHADVERFFSRLQVLDACYLSFAHGANDVANAVGPMVGVLQALKGNIVAKAAVPTWILAIGGIGIVAGLATYGYKVIESVGRKITEVTPTRGFAAEFGTATTVLLCSLMGLPISTTFVLVGAVMGVGFARGFGAIDMKVVRRIFTSWLITIPASALLAAAIFRVAMLLMAG